jgi:myo-inositol-1(or 4)-monophosphatase
VTVVTRALDDEISARQALALDVAAAAGRLALDFWRRREALAVEAKASALDVVSEADRSVERLIRARVAEAFPDDGFLGEEYGAEAGRSGFTWVIDPIDGTRPYLHGIPSWCVALAVAAGPETVLAVTEAPTHGETYAARRGAGATLNGAALSLPAGLGVAAAATGVGASHRTDPAWIGRVTEGLGRAGGVFFRNGSGALMLAYVAAGRLAGYVEPHMHAWDCLGGLLMVREAGGRTAAYPEAGDLARGGRVIAAAPDAWETLEELMIGAGA